MKAFHPKKRSQTQQPKPAGAGGRGITIAALTLALGAAVYLNWTFAQGAPILTAGSDAAGNLVEAAADAAGEEVGGSVAVYDALDTAGSETGSAQQTSDGESANKNYGEAELVSVNKDSGTEFFEQARLARSKARDEALKELESALKKAELSKEEKDELTTRLSAQLGAATKESDLETLIKAKGFADCVVMLGTDSADITVMTENDALTSAEVTQIRDVVLSRCPDMSAQGITVVEVK